MRVFGLLVLIIITSIPLFSEPYRLSDLIERGLESSTDILIEENNVRSSSSSYRSSWYGLLPTAMISAGRVNSEQSVYDPVLGTYDAEREWRNSASFSLSKDISLNESSYYDIRTSYYSLSNSRLSFTEMRQETAYYIFYQYLQVLEYQKRVEIQRGNVELQQRIYGQIEVQYQSGEKSLLDLKQSEISLIDYEIALLEAENMLSQLRRDLFRYLDLSDSGAEFEELEYAVELPSFDYRVNNELMRKQNSLRSSRLRRSQRLLDFLPTLSIGYSYYQQSQSQSLDDFDAYDDSYTLSLTARMPVFDLLDKRERYVRTGYEVRNLELDLADSEQKLRNDLVNLRNDLSTVERSLELYTEKLRLAEENLNMAQEQYRLGMVSLLDLDRSVIDYQNARLQYNSSYYELIRKAEEINKKLSLPILGKW